MNEATKSQTRLPHIEIPAYTKSEEIFNMTSHIVGAVLGIIATVLCVAIAGFHQNSLGVVSGAIFGTSMIVLYCMSSIYHGLHPGTFAKKIFRIFDHCSIYLLVAGTCTPIALCVVRAADPTLGWLFFGSVWTLAIIGMTLSAINLHKFRVLAMIIYMGMGWSAILFYQQIIVGLGPVGFGLLVAGGISYVIGTIFLGLGKKKCFAHCIFHLFVVLGSLLHLLCIALFAL